MKGTLSELHRRGNDVQRKGWTNSFLHFLIDSLWRDPAGDVKVKYDAADPTAGYLEDKIKQGGGIIIQEGTGADENKMVIQNTVQFTYFT